MKSYKVACVNGRFGHVTGKRAALMAARRMVKAPSRASETDLRRHWGVTITPVSSAFARSVGLT